MQDAKPLASEKPAQPFRVQDNGPEIMLKK
jgi:hypothetical protein